MYSNEDINRIKLILTKIDFILDICQDDGIVNALEDERTNRPAIMMHLTAIAEQFSKVKDNNILNQFELSDIKGAVDTRNFIAHDYEGINLPIIEFIIRERLPILKKIIIKIIEEK